MLELSLYNLTVKQINKADTAERLEVLQHKVDIFQLGDRFTDEQYEDLTKMIREKIAKLK